MNILYLYIRMHFVLVYATMHGAFCPVAVKRDGTSSPCRSLPACTACAPQGPPGARSEDQNPCDTAVIREVESVLRPQSRGGWEHQRNRTETAKPVRRGDTPWPIISSNNHLRIRHVSSMPSTMSPPCHKHVVRHNVMLIAPPPKRPGAMGPPSCSHGSSPHHSKEI